MIQLSRNYSLPEREERNHPDQSDRCRERRVKCTRSHRARWDGQVRSHRRQHRCAIARQFGGRDESAIGRSITRGLGTGGDPELGFDAAQEAADEIRQAAYASRG